ncbi:MAG: DMT family transporter [Rhizobiales bacterium]|nr:DMT family transporter [Hyphomicrobiales bacterium]
MKHSVNATTLPARESAVAFAALVVGAFAMGASPIFVRLADVGPFASAFWRCALALPFLALWALTEPKETRAMFSTDRAVVLSGLFFAGDLFFWHLSILATTIANATFIATMAPVWVAFGAWIVFRERISRGNFLGLALCLIGGAALVGQSYSFAPERLVGDGYALITSIFFGLYILAISNARTRTKIGVGSLAFMSAAITCACMFVIAMLFETNFMPRSMNGWLTLLALAIISQVLGQGLLAIALGKLPATFSSLVIFLEAVGAAALGWLVLSEALGPIQGLGGALILLGIWVARPRAKAPAAAL